MMHYRWLSILSQVYLLPTLLLTAHGAPVTDGSSPPLRKIKDVIIYQDDRFYSAFPSVVRRPDGGLLVAFRRAPNRRALGERNHSHTDPNSYLVGVRSHDDGATWSESPELIFAHPFGGSQDPCMIQLRDGAILCASYGWALLDPQYAQSLGRTSRHGNFGFLGGYILRSRDGGRSWQGPFLPPHVPSDVSEDIFGKPVRAFNRGAMCQASDGGLYWVVVAKNAARPGLSETHLLISANQGESWEYGCRVASDSKVTFNETSLYETPKGVLVAFLRTANLDDHTAVARSTNHGRSFQAWEDAGFQGHPHFALRLPDQRVFLVYGYRHAPFGIRARVLDPECSSLATAPELVLRDDGGNGDLGYPWATLISNNRVLVVYYFNRSDGTRHIAGTVLEIADR